MAASDSGELLHDFSPFLKQYKDGRVERPYEHALDFAPPSLDPETGVQSKDVDISPEIRARLFLPKSAISGQKLPLLIYFHGGGFVTGSAFCPLFANHLNHLVSESNVLAVSVEYRIAPEHPLPIAYDDSWLAVKWIASQSKPGENPNSDEWIRDFADFDRVYLGGDSAGGNIAHNTAIRVGTEKLGGINLRGMFLNCPFFWGESRIGQEEEHYKVPANFYAHDLWRYACPGSSGCDDPLIDPGMDPNLSKLGCKRVLVCVGREDFLRDRGCHYKEALEKSGWGGDVEVVDVEGEGHCFSVIKPTCDNAIAMVKKVAKFLNE